MAPERSDVTFPSGSDTCAAWLYPAPSQSRSTGASPCVILGHGIGGVKEMRLDGCVALARVDADLCAASASASRRPGTPASRLTTVTLAGRAVCHASCSTSNASRTTGARRSSTLARCPAWTLIESRCSEALLEAVRQSDRAACSRSRPCHSACRRGRADRGDDRAVPVHQVRHAPDRLAR